MLFETVLRELRDAGVKFVVVGGVAANVQGSPRLTYDIDICYDPSPGNTATLARVLSSWHAYLRGVEPGLPFTVDAKQFRLTPVMTLTSDRGDIDVMDRVAGVGEFADVYASSVEIDVDGLRFRALDLDGLVRAKRAASRPKDLQQLPELEALRELRRKERRGGEKKGG